MKKPTIKEIADFCVDRKNDIDAEYFFHHYESIGWVRVVGKREVAIKSWKSVIVTWEKQGEKRKFVREPNKDSGFMERIEAKLKESGGADAIRKRV